VTAAVLGTPVGHSRSPAIWRAAFAAAGLDWTYGAVELGEAELPAWLRAAAADPAWRVVSVTMPLKQAAYRAVDERRTAVGAANTVLFEAGRTIGHNTDVDGILGAVAEMGLLPRRVAVLGAGGTARAVLAACETWGADHVLVTRAAWDRATEHMAAADLVVNTTPAGAADALPWAGGALLDVLYAPWPTPLARAALAAGVPVRGGLPVLVHQAAAAFALATGLPAPVEAMRAAATD
jgi:shikimate dehydrogenase